MSEQRKKLRLGELLIQQGLITPDQLRIALTEQKNQQAPLGRLLVRVRHRSLLAPDGKCFGDGLGQLLAPSSIPRF